MRKLLRWYEEHFCKQVVVKKQYGGYFSSYKGIASCGKTREEAIMNAVKAYLLYKEVS